MKFRLLFILIAAIAAIAGACSTGSQPGNKVSSDGLTVSAAVSLKEAFTEISDLYKTKTGRTINFNFGASGVLQKQIETGAPVDVFASAGEKQMDDLAKQNLIDMSTRRDFARNTLVLIVPRDSKLDLTTFSDLVKPSVQKIAIGNPKTVPAGQYTDELFDKIKIKNDLQPKLVLAEDVRQVLDYVVRGEADAGVVYATDAGIAGDKVRVAATALEDSHSPILYPIAVIKDSKQKQSADDFVDLVMSGEGQAVLKRYGFARVTEK